MKQLQVSEATPKALRAALKEGVNVMLFDGGEPVGQLVFAAAELQRRKEFFQYYPHDASECFSSCWRHTEAGAADEVVLAKEGTPVLA